MDFLHEPRIVNDSYYWFWIRHYLLIAVKKHVVPPSEVCFFCTIMLYHIIGSLDPYKSHSEDDVPMTTMSLGVCERMAHDPTYSIYQKKIENLPRRWEKWIYKLGDYMEK